MTKISIIMPVYNGAQWLTESIDSVLAQTFKDFELICVNDSSTDNSEEIIKNYSKQDSRIKCFTKENEGPGVALNFGIEKAQGKYLCFIDQDDKYSLKYLEIMHKAITKSNCNLCQCNAYFWKDKKITRVPYPKTKTNKKILDISNAKKKRIFSEHYFPQWTKIIKKDFLIKNNIKFPNRENKAHDVPVHYKLIGLCNRIGYIKSCIYYHRVHLNQISYNFDAGLYYLMSIKDILDWMKNNKIDVQKRKKLKKYLKQLFKHSAIRAKNLNIFDELSQISAKNYYGFDRYDIKNFVQRKQKKFKINTI